ncbi:ribosomal L27 protein-domain-containing protein [Stachybotrys elegans]|uniref:Large ribosomal subunit protein bL27m n=1 Tax=Stachybotrys elegans TaxID=80388 RepID=A0A8K0WQI1_9HYPO|nr:ribosomal L27 protein-domain-containing protein [Stachybotrys elegans]
MRFLALQRPILAAATGLARAGFNGVVAPFAAQPVNSSLVQGWRFASVKAQGAYKKRNTKGIPKKLGAKRTGDQYVIPGNIIYKQRGTLWWPGENCIMGRDHTIHAMATGYVKYYRDPAKHPDRKYIGVVFDKNDTLPYPVHAERKRRLNKMTFPIRQAAPEPELSASGIPTQVTRLQENEPDRLLRLRDDYSYREDNWRIGQLVETAQVRKTRFRTRKQWFRRRRWLAERNLEGQRKAAARRAELGEEVQVKKKVLSKKQAKKAKKAAK